MSSGRKKSLDAALEEVRRFIVIEGARTAAATLIEVCKNPRASPQAKSSAGSALLRASGLFDKPSEKLADKEPHEMSAGEVAAAIKRVENEALHRQTRSADSDAFE